MPRHAARGLCPSLVAAQAAGGRGQSAAHQHAHKGERSRSLQATRVGRDESSSSMPLCACLSVHSKRLSNTPHTLHRPSSLSVFPPGSLPASFSFRFSSFPPSIVLLPRLRAKATPQAAAASTPHHTHKTNHEDKQTHVPGLGPGHGLLQHDLGLLDALPQCQGTCDTGASRGVWVGRYLARPCCSASPLCAISRDHRLTHPFQTPSLHTTRYGAP